MRFFLNIFRGGEWEAAWWARGGSCIKVMVVPTVRTVSVKV